MPKLVEAFELPEEDFLPVRPSPLQLVGAFSEIDPPNWALKCTSKVGGKRHPKRERISSQYDSRALMPWTSLGQEMGPHGPRVSADAEAAYNKALDRQHRKRASKASQSPETPLPAGNLVEDDYRFWKGYALEESERNNAQCRWCGTSCIGRDTMLRHHNKGWCKEYLLALYRFAIHSSKQRYCFACKAETQERKWGIPLCHKVMCRGRWKFNLTHFLVGFVQYRQWAEEAQKRDPASGPFRDLPDPNEDVMGTPC